MQISAGDDAPLLVAALVARQKPIASIRLFWPKPFPRVQDAMNPTESEREILDEALALRESTGLSFWDAILLLGTTRLSGISRFVEYATRHNSQRQRSVVIARRDCTEDHLRALISELSRGEILAVSSMVETEGQGARHIPMLDFHCGESATNLALVKIVVAELGLTGFIARSGASYHFYGNELVDELALIGILGKALLLSPIVDHRWIAHQILERACGLRISPGKQYERSPEVVAEVD